MTIREFYEHVLTELNKVEAPSLLLEDFNYFANKAVQQYINEVYNRYDINQQSTDDLRALKTSAQEFIEDSNLDKEDLSRDVVRYFPGESEGYYAVLPENYLHMLNCVVTFKKNVPPVGCSIEKSQVHSMARRLTSDMYPSILQNAYLKPSYKCPYYFINNTKYEVELNSAYKLEMILEGLEVEDKPDAKCRIEIRCGDTSKYTPYMVYFDYIRTPSKIELTYDDLDAIEDSTKELEFPEYVCYEIINRFVKLALENASDPRLETNFPINQTIAGVSNNN